MEIFFQQVVNGIMLGSVYGLVAVGFALLLGVLGVANLAHGEVAMIGAFVCLTMTRLGVPFPAALFATAMATAALSVVIERLCFRPFRKVDIMVPMLSTIGMSIVLQSAGARFWGSSATSFQVGLEVVTYTLGSVRISSVHFIIVLMALGLMVGLSWVIYRTKVGRAWRAIAESPGIARAIGINAGPVIVLAFAISGPIAGIAGILIGLNATAISPSFGLDMTIKAIVAMVVGGMGSLYGAMVAGLIIGFAETFTVGYLSAAYRDGFVYGLLLLVLLVRPEGLLGRLEQRRV